MRLVTHLGENAVVISRDLSGRIAEDLHVDVEARAASSAGDVTEGGADLYWLCGLLTTVFIDSGQIDGEIVAAPVFPGRAGPTYRSVIVATSPSALSGDRSRARLVINERGSWSGHHALRSHLSDASDASNAFGSIIVSGAHDASIDLLLAGDADVAAIDDTIWEFRAERDDRLAELHVLDRTRPWPAPPFTIDHRVPAETAAALTDALLDARPAGLDRIVPATNHDYDPIRAAIAGTVAT